MSTTPDPVDAAAKAATAPIKIEIIFYPAEDRVAINGNHKDPITVIEIIGRGMLFYSEYMKIQRAKAPIITPGLNS